MEELAINGGRPASETLIPVARPMISEEAVREVAEVMRSGQLRQGPKTQEFELRFRERTGARYAYAVSSGTAALHTVYLSTLAPGDEVIVPDFSFFATASTVLYAGGRPVFADIDPETFLIDPEDVKEKITPRTRAISPVHLFGNAADMEALSDLAEDRGLLLVHDSAQAHGTEVGGRDIGSFDDANCFSFYPTKSMTTGEGGMVTTNDPHQAGPQLPDDGYGRGPRAGPATPPRRVPRAQKALRQGAGGGRGPDGGAAAAEDDAGREPQLQLLLRPHGPRGVQVQPRRVRGGG